MMDNMANLAATINVSSAELNVGEGVTGILKRETDPTSIDNVFFAYKSPNDSISVGGLLLFDLHTCVMSTD